MKHSPHTSLILTTAAPGLRTGVPGRLTSWH